MSDEPISAGYQPAVEPGQVSPQPNNEPPKPVTWDDLKAWREETLEAAKRAAQSQAGKQVTAVEKKLAQWEERLKGQGIPVDDNLRQQARRELALQELREPGDDNPAAQPVAQPDRKLLAKINRVNALLSEVEADTDTDIRTVPEFRDFNWQDPDPDRAYQEAERRKELVKQRLTGAQPPAQSPGSPAARAGSPQGAPAGGDLMAQYQREVNQPGLTMDQKIKIRMDYRKKGLNL